MARSARTKARLRTGWPEIEEGLLERLRAEPRAVPLGLIVVLLAAALYLYGLGYPLIFADFAALSAGQLNAYAHALPALGRNWLGEATFGWTGLLAGIDWPWHRALNLTIHAAAVLTAFALFRRLLTAGQPPGGANFAPGWIAFLGAAFFALHPAAVYGVAYLSARSGLLLGLFSLIALWSTVRTLQQGGRLAWIVAPLAVAAGVAASAGAVAIPVAMTLLVWALPSVPADRRRAWMSVALAALLVLAYVAALAAMPAAAAETATRGYAAALAAASSRFLHYLGLWIIPVTSFMAIDMPEPDITIASAWPGWLGLAGLGALLALLAWRLRRRDPGLARTAALAVGCAAALYAGELFWPRLAAPLALARSYAWMPCVALAPACLVAALPRRGAWIVACIALFAWLVLAADTLQTFSSHIALWDDAVRRIERSGAKAQDARVYLNRATVHRREGHTLAALEDYDKALVLQPDMTRALRGRAQVYIDEKRYGEALRDLDRVLELEPGQAITHADRALVLMQTDRLNEAGRAFDRAIERGAREPKVYLNRGLTRLKLGGLGAAPAALADIEHAIALDPDYALAYYNRAMVFEQAAQAGFRLRDALSPELMRTVATQNMGRACQLGYAPACEQERARKEDMLPGMDEGPRRVSPQTLRSQGLPAR